MTTVPLWTSSEAEKATGGRNNKDWTATGVTIDSRQVKPGDLFVALRGPNFNGHDFAAMALAKGAAAALVDHIPAGTPRGAALLMVEDTEKALNNLGAYARSRCGGKIIGVTGSVGKTGVKDALAHVLGKQGRCVSTQGNLNNHLGLPLSLARMPADTQYGVFEMGMNHVGELSALSKMARPHVAVITTVALAHGEFFANEEAIADAKAEIFEGLDGDGIAILNSENRHFDRLVKAAKNYEVIPFGYADSVEIDENGSTISATVGGRTLSYRVNMPGKHWVTNSLAVLNTVEALGANVIAAAKDIAEVAPSKGRGERHLISLRGGSFTLIDESYNASPAAMEAAIFTLASSQPGEFGRRIAVLGDMLELGSEEAELHAALVHPLEAGRIDKVFTAGKRMSHLRDALLPKMRGGHATDSQALALLVSGIVRDGDVLMVKGSAGSKMGLVIQQLLQLGAADQRTVNGH